jgi:ribonuclease Y
MYFLIGFFLGGLGMFLFWKVRVGSLKKVAIHLVKKSQEQAFSELEKSRLELMQEKEALNSLKLRLEKERKKTQKLLIKEQELTHREKTLKMQTEELAGITKKEAAKLIHSLAEKEAAEDAAMLVHKAVEKAKQQGEQEAKKLLITILGRLSKTGFSEIGSDTILVQDPLIRAKIIGKEGRNIKYFQQKTQIVAKFEEEALILSSFDPQKRLTAKIAIEELIQTGSFNPETIATAIEKAANLLDAELLKRGYEAASSCQVLGLHKMLVSALGKLSLRTSCGQNLLEHSIEASLIARLLAAELKLDQAKASRMALLHDIGKVLPEQYGSTHALAGSRLALECQEPADIVNAIAAHHNEVDSHTLEAEVCKIADALSAARPGVRTHEAGEFLKKMTSLETLALSFEQVDQAFAFESGRKMHIVVKPQYSTLELRHLLLSKLQAKIQEYSPQNNVEIFIL